MVKVPKLRYWIAFLLFLATTINYADRLMLAVVSPHLRSELNLSEQDYGQILSWFMAAYAVMYAASGPIADRLGTRRSFALFITVWSAAAMGHALAVGKWSLIFWRFMLGLGEPGNFPAAAKAVAEWFPAEQRALGVGIFNAGSTMGSALAPPMVVFLTLHFGWRAAFLFTGSLGILWLLAWLLLYQPPHRSRLITPGEWDHLKDRVRPPEETVGRKLPKGEWLRVLRMRECYALVLARFLADPVIYFIVFWLPEYLRRERNFDLAMIGKYAWVPFIFGDIGYVTGGWLSGYLMRRGWPLPKARRLVLAMGAALMPAAIFAPVVSEAWMAIGLTCVVTLAHALWISNLLTLPTDLFPGSRVGTATGLSGMGGAVGGILTSLGTGYVVQNFSYRPIFTVAGVMHPIALGILLVLLRGFFNPPKPERAAEV
ncbi:MAG: MFS transporter [Bryobacterales bacterium]|nr:MFS transporter [Bryobacterales bacterium]